MSTREFTGLFDDRRTCPICGAPVVIVESDYGECYSGIPCGCMWLNLSCTDDQESDS